MVYRLFVVIFVALHGGGLNMDLGFIRAVGEIKMHKKVIGIEFPKRNEVYIRFEDTFADLIIPLTPSMDSKLLLGIFYNYLELPDSLLHSA